MYMKLEKDLCKYGNRKEFETDAHPRDNVSVLSGVNELSATSFALKERLCVYGHGVLLKPVLVTVFT